MAVKGHLQITTIFVLVLITTGVVENIKSREVPIVEKLPLLDFPLSISNWAGKFQAIEVNIIEFLEISDYTMINYQRGNDVINLYIAYYDSLQNNAFPHSPRKCIPGGGWEIDTLQTIEAGNKQVRRVSIQRNSQRQIVYYWYQQGDKSLPDEYQLKWNTFLRSLNEGRTDTSLVRLTIPVDNTDLESSADEKLVLFLQELEPEIKQRLY